MDIKRQYWESPSSATRSWFYGVPRKRQYYAEGGEDVKMNNTCLNHESFKTQIAKAAQDLAHKTHPEDKANLQSITVVANYYGESYLTLASLSHLGQKFAALGQYHIAKWTKKPSFQKLKKISALRKDWLVLQNSSEVLTQHHAFPEDQMIFLSYLTTLQEMMPALESQNNLGNITQGYQNKKENVAVTKNEGKHTSHHTFHNIPHNIARYYSPKIMNDWQLNISLSLYHETGHLIEHEPILTPQNAAWTNALKNLNNQKWNTQEMRYIGWSIKQTMEKLPEEMFADCFAILVAELTGWGDRKMLAQETSLWRKNQAQPKSNQEECVLAWMTHYTHSACDLLGKRDDKVTNTKEAKELAGLIAWKAWHQLQTKMTKKLWFFKKLGLGQGNDSFYDFINTQLQNTPNLPSPLNEKPPSTQNNNNINSTTEGCYINNGCSTKQTADNRQYIPRGTHETRSEKTASRHVFMKPFKLV